MADCMPLKCFIGPSFLTLNKYETALIDLKHGMFIEAHHCSVHIKVHYYSDMPLRDPFPLFHGR